MYETLNSVEHYQVHSFNFVKLLVSHGVIYHMVPAACLQVSSRNSKNVLQNRWLLFLMQLLSVPDDQKNTSYNANL